MRSYTRRTASRSCSALTYASSSIQCSATRGFFSTANSRRSYSFCGARRSAGTLSGAGAGDAALGTRLSGAVAALAMIDVESGLGP